MARARMRMVRWQPERLLDALSGDLAPRMERAAQLVETRVKQSMVGGGSPHVPSAPGEPPHVDTGQYRRSITHSVMVTRRSVRGYVIANGVQARALELGYPPGNLLPRPHLRPQLTNARTRADVYRIITGSGRPLGSIPTLAEIKAITAGPPVSFSPTGGA